MRSLFSSVLGVMWVLGASLLSAQTPSTPAPAIDGVPLAQIATVALRTERDSFWVGELFTLTEDITVARRQFQSLGGPFDWSSPQFNAEDWSSATSNETRNKVHLTRTTRTYARTAGPAVLPPGRQPLTLVTDIAANGQPLTDGFLVSSAPLALNFKPLPMPAPVEFAKAVGNFTLKAKAAATQVAVGESVTWTVELAGTGNWPEISRLPAQTISRDFQIVTPVTKRVMSRGQLFEGSLTQEMLLIPSRPGAYQLGPVRFVYFDPKAGTYQMLTSESVALTVTGEAAAPGTIVPLAAAANSSSGGADRLPVPVAPPTLPLDPVAGSRFGLPPFASSSLILFVVLPVALVVAWWLRLAASRRYATDPQRRRREARARIKAELAHLAGAVSLSRAQVVQHLRAWQHAAAEFAEISEASPTPAQIAGALEHVRTGSSWAQLWRDANHVIYGETQTLPADWLLRAHGALSDAPLADVPLLALFLRRNLFPWAALLACAFLSLPVRADAGSEAYRTGDFKKAEAAWRSAIAAAPRDAAPRANLAAALAQQNRWSESAAHALAAFSLAPQDAAIRWQFNLSLERAGIDQPAFVALATGAGWGGLARRLSPGAWGVALAWAALVWSLALALWLWSHYRALPVWLRRVAELMMVLAVVLGGSALMSVRTYGLLAQNDIAVVAQNTVLRSVPTEATNAQKTSPLPAGSLAVVDQAFLGWSRLVFPNGQTGWVRTDAVVTLYR
jgi:tetratricopeptide (TPR) repeat protein